MNYRVLRQFVLLLTLPVGVAYCQITPSDDAYTDTATPTTKLGAKPTAGVASPAQTSFVTFDLSSIPAGTTGAGISKATLKLFVNTVVTAGSFNVVYVNGTWSEKTITADLSPALGANIVASVPLDKTMVKDYLLVDITPALKAWLDGTQANDGIALVANSPLVATFDTKENTTNSHPPELDVVLTGGTITGITTGANSGLVGGTNSGVANLSLLTSCSNGQILAWNGTKWACKTVGGTGTVTSVGISAPASDFTVSGSPVTTSGTLGLNWTVAPTSANSANAIVKRDGLGGFSAGYILADSPGDTIPAVSATSSTHAAAVSGSANDYGGLFVSGKYGVWAEGDLAGGVFGGPVGVEGFSSGATRPGVLGIGNSLSSVGQLLLGTAAAGVWADNPNFGLVATSDLNAVVAYNNNSTAATIYGENDTTSVSSLLFYATAPKVTGSPVCYINAHADLVCSGSKSAVVPVDNGTRKVALYAVEAPENWFEDFGSGRLSNGEAVIELEPTFAQTVNTAADYHVFLTPRGECEGLYIDKATAGRFTVRELHHGASSVAFDYRIVARRKDYENIRLADMTKMIGDQAKFGPKPAQSATPPPSIGEMRNKFRPVAMRPVPAGRYGARSNAPE